MPPAYRLGVGKERPQVVDRAVVVLVEDVDLGVFEVFREAVGGLSAVSESEEGAVLVAHAKDIEGEYRGENLHQVVPEIGIALAFDENGVIWHCHRLCLWQGLLSVYTPELLEDSTRPSLGPEMLQVIESDDGSPRLVLSRRSDVAVGDQSHAL